ncbi:MAG: hypothetical protein Q9159_007312 [Coniocarpon cinnabarinum]
MEISIKALISDDTSNTHVEHSNTSATRIPSVFSASNNSSVSSANTSSASPTVKTLSARTAFSTSNTYPATTTRPSPASVAGSSSHRPTNVAHTDSERRARQAENTLYSIGESILLRFGCPLSPSKRQNVMGRRHCEKSVILKRLSQCAWLLYTLLRILEREKDMEFWIRQAGLENQAGFGFSGWELGEDVKRALGCVGVWDWAFEGWLDDNERS